MVYGMSSYLRACASAGHRRGCTATDESGSRPQATGPDLLLHTTAAMSSTELCLRRVIQNIAEVTRDVHEKEALFVNHLQIFGIICRLFADCLRDYW